MSLWIAGFDGFDVLIPGMRTIITFPILIQAIEFSMDLLYTVYALYGEH
jgi:hypothetical protein